MSDCAVCQPHIVPCFTWLVSQICCTPMDVLTVKYRDLVTTSVFWLVFVALFVTNVMYYNMFEKSLYSNYKNLY